VSNPSAGIQGRRRLPEAAERVVKLCQTWGKPEKGRQVAREAQGGSPACAKAAVTTSPEGGDGREIWGIPSSAPCMGCKPRRRVAPKRAASVASARHTKGKTKRRAHEPAMSRTSSSMAFRCFEIRDEFLGLTSRSLCRLQGGDAPKPAKQGFVIRLSARPSWQCVPSDRDSSICSPKTAWISVRAASLLEHSINPARTTLRA
jgi:hypothetical protein